MHRTVRWRPPANFYGWIQLPFKLEHLHLDLYWTIMHAPSLIVAALISSAHESAVLDFKLPLPNSNGKRAPLLGVNSHFPARYAPVKELTLRTDPGDVNHEILRYLLPQYPGFYALKDLTISFINVSILECLRTPLARLVVTEDINLDSVAFTHKLFNSGVKATSSLEHLGVYGHIFVNHKTLLECEVEKREIKLSVGRPAVSGAGARLLHPLLICPHQNADPVPAEPGGQAAILQSQQVVRRRAPGRGGG